jgi:hypothetical protein
VIGRPIIRTAWFAAGAAAGVYGTVKARRVAYRLSGPGIIDQAAALGVGWRAFSADLREGMREREDAVVTRLDPAASHLQLLSEDTLPQVLRSAPNRVVPPG